MSEVPQSAYRKPVTPHGLEAIEKGTLTWLDDDMYNNFNTGVLEQYFEEKNVAESFEISHWSTPKVLLGVFVGAIFSGITAYLGLKVGLAIQASLYIAYLLGMALRWTPSETNIAASAATGANTASTGFIFTFPAIILLAQTGPTAQYLVGDTPLIQDPDILKLAFIGITASIFAGFVGVMYFVIFRRVWLVEDPLPMPGFEANIKLLDITADINTGAADSARDSLRTVGLWTGLTMGFMFLIEYPIAALWGKHGSLMDAIASAIHVPGSTWLGLSSILGHSSLHQPVQLDPDTGEGVYATQWDPDGGSFQPFAYTNIGIAFAPSLFAIGWFMRTRVALLVNAGTLFAWALLVPFAVLFNVAVFDASYIGADTPEPYIRLKDYATVVVGGPAAIQMIAFGKLVRVAAIGTILGGGLTGLLKMAPTFVNIFGDIGKAISGGEGGQDYQEGKGWYEWPVQHIPFFMGLAFLSSLLVFWVAGFPFIASFTFALVLVLTTFLLGAIAVRVMGETSIEPVSGTSFIVLMLLLGIFLNFRDALNLTKEEAIIMGLVGTTVFAGAISFSGSVVGDYKNSLYVGSRPYHISKGNMFGIVPGTIIGAIVSIWLAYEISKGTIDLAAPQANAFATFTVILSERQGDMKLLALGVGLGIFIELMTGMGTSFGLGMYLLPAYTLPMIIGGYARDKWEETRLEPRVEAEGGNEQLRAVYLLGTFMLATGLIVGEVAFGLENALLGVLDSLVSNPDSIGWAFTRLALFVVGNAALGGALFWAMWRIGIFGGGDGDVGGGDGGGGGGGGILDADVLEAEAA